jgi:hypothetical protein
MIYVIGSNAKRVLDRCIPGARPANRHSSAIISPAMNEQAHKKTALENELTLAATTNGGSMLIVVITGEHRRSRTDRRVLLVNSQPTDARKCHCD